MRGRDHPSTVDDLRIGRIGRALRHRLRWRQRDLGSRVGLSQGEISLFESGRLAAMPIGTVRRILGGLDAELVLTVRWRGGDLDRLLDAAHAQLGDDLALADDHVRLDGGAAVGRRGAVLVDRDALLEMDQRPRQVGGNQHRSLSTAE